MPGQAPGQHYFARSDFAARLVADARVGPRDLVVEIGAGTGMLTRALASRARLVVAVELDARLARKLGRRFAGTPNVVVLHGDALTMPLPAAPFRVVANPPFGIAGALLRRLLDAPHPALTRADLVVQWQVARARALARGVPGWQFRRGRRMPASWFRPRPSVDAAVLTVVRRSR